LPPGIATTEEMFLLKPWHHRFAKFLGQIGTTPGIIQKREKARLWESV